MKFWEPETRKLFNIRKDIGEINDLDSTIQEKARKLHDTLMRYLRSMNTETLKLV